LGDFSKLYQFYNVPICFIIFTVMAELKLKYRSQSLDLLAGPVVMGILNVTPDSFSDGGQFPDAGAAIERGLEMAAQGAKIIDVGGESTRPGAKPVAVDEQIRRVTPVIEGLTRQTDVVISVDTTQSKVAQAALDAGAAMINDITALGADSQLAKLIASHKAAIVLMHMQGQPQTMQKKPRYINILQEVTRFLQQRIDQALQAGIGENCIVIDPGIGFEKTVNHNLLLIRELSQLHALKKPILMGVSRKSFIGKTLGIDSPADRGIGTAVAHAWCVAGNAHILRVHDVKETLDVINMVQAIGSGRIKGGDA
jgi:dihydropteroate synthase